MDKVTIEVEGNEEDLEYLSEKLNFKEINLVENKYIESIGIIPIDDNVYENAVNFIQELNKILKLDPKVISSLKVKSVSRFDHEKNKMVKTNVLDVPVTITITGEDLSLDYQLLFKFNSANENVRNALIFFSQGYDWYNLYKVYETIRKDIKDKKEHLKSSRKGLDQLHNTFENKGWTTKEKMDIFYCTANNFKFAKHDSRHAEDIPNWYCQINMKNKDSMNLSEATQLIRHLLIKWINSLEYTKSKP